MMRELYTHKETSPAAVTQEGPLAGKKIILQPNMSVRGWPTNAGVREPSKGMWPLRMLRLSPASGMQARYCAAARG